MRELKQITEIKHERMPRTFEAIAKRIEESERWDGIVVFRGLMYEPTVGGQIFQVGFTRLADAPFENDWVDADFGFEDEDQPEPA